MWKWLKKKPCQSDDELRALAEKLIGPQALAVALAERVRDYVAAVQTGRISYPAHRREGASVLEIWADLRIEALHKMFNFGQSNPFLLSDHLHQEELLACFLKERPYLEMPQPRGTVIPDTIQAVLQVYLYLDAAGSEVADRETDRAGLKLVRRSILDRMESECAELQRRLSTFRVSKGEGKAPTTMIELLYEDVTAKAKSIALSANFGPHYEVSIKFLEDQLAEQGEDLVAFRASVARLMAAKDPDYLPPGL